MTVFKRNDGRMPEQIRVVRFIRDYTKYAEGSVLIQCGDTHVLCTASVVDKVPSFLKGKGQGWITAEYGMLPRATSTRTDREAAKGKQSGRTQEIQRLIGRSLRAIIDLTKIGERTIHIDCDVIQADGGTRTTSITGSYIALKTAIQRMLAKGLITENPLKDSVFAVSVGIVNNVPLLDLNFEEDSGCDADMNVVMTGSGKFVEIQGTAEGEPWDETQLSDLLKLARNGILQLQKLELES